MTFFSLSREKEILTFEIYVIIKKEYIWDRQVKI